MVHYKDSPTHIMGEFLEYFKEKKNLTNLLILGIMILALPLGINLVRQQQIIKSRADVVPIAFKGDNVVSKNGQLVAIAPQITLELTSPLGPPAKLSGTQLVMNQSFGKGSVKGLVKTAYAEGDLFPCDRPDQLQIREVNPNYTCGADANGCRGTAYVTYTDYTTDEDGDGIADPANPGDQPWCDNTCGDPKSCPVDDSWCTEMVVEGKKVVPCTEEDTLTGQGSCLKNGQTCTQYYLYECTTSTGVDYCSKPASKCAEPCQGGPSPSPSVSPSPSSSPRASPSPSPSSSPKPGVCELGTDMFGMTDACAACVLTGSGNPELVKDIKDLGAKYGNQWGACGNTQLIGKWCDAINKPACDTIKATPECAPVCGGAPQTSCPADITSTEARMRSSGNDTWTSSLTINLGDNVFVGGFHNQQIDKVADDVVLTATGPEGPASFVQTLIPEAGVTVYKPSSVGKYTITAATKGKTGANCTGTATLTVRPVPVTTVSFRIAESSTDLNSAAWQDYTAEPMSISYEFKDQKPGVKTVFVQFKDSTGKVTSSTDCPRCQAQIKLLSKDPEITGCSLSFEGVNTVLNISGKHFGSVKGSIKSGENTLDVRSWKEGSVIALWSNAPSGQVIPITLTNEDNQTGEGQCSAISQLSFGAKLICRAPVSSDTDNVDLSIAEAFEGGKLTKHKVKIGKDGLVQNLSQKLENGKQYILSVKIPGSIRKTSGVFTAGGGVTSLPNFVLPVGDIFPIEEGDGMINSLDKSELNRQWIIASAASSRSGDFNRDSRVNSMDWACMRYGFGKSDDPEPVPGVVVSSPGPVSSPSPLSSSSPSPGL